MGHRADLGGVEAYLADPPGDRPVEGGLVLIHEIWGLVDHITDVADRFAAEGFRVVAPDLLGPVGISPHLGLELQEILFSDDERVRSEGQPRLREAMAPTRAPEFAGEAIARLRTCVDALAAMPDVDGRIGVVGFCFGGSYSFALAAADPRIRVAVPFYGAPPEATDVAAIRAPVLGFYGRSDERLVAGLPGVVSAMAEAGVDFEAQVYEGVGHAFFNDTNRRTYDAATAADAWRRTLAFLRTAFAALPEATEA
jgi:carboxymethylenebutenolidase